MKGIILTLLFISSHYSIACLNGEYLLPENDLRIPVTKNQSGISEEDFNSIIREFEAIYTPMFKERGWNLKINNNWKSSIVNARAHRRGRTRFVTMFGGMARHKEMNKLGFALVVCHEIGHHIGGAPQAFGGMSNEGQADYFASTKCMRRYLRKKDFKTNKTFSVAEEKCNKLFTNAQEVNHCILTAQGSMSLSRIFAVLQGVDMPMFETPDTSIARRTNYKHPPAQCRLDTFFAGALCDNDIDTPFSGKDEAQGACYKASGDEFGYRPHCWFRPKR